MKRTERRYIELTQAKASNQWKEDTGVLPNVNCLYQLHSAAQAALETADGCFGNSVTANAEVGNNENMEVPSGGELS